jgi:hypothetical protein
MRRSLLSHAFKSFQIIEIRNDLDIVLNRRYISATCPDFVVIIDVVLLTKLLLKLLVFD